MMLFSTTCKVDEAKHRQQIGCFWPEWAHCIERDCIMYCTVLYNMHKHKNMNKFHNYRLQRTAADSPENIVTFYIVTWRIDKKGDALQGGIDCSLPQSFPPGLALFIQFIQYKWTILPPQQTTHGLTSPEINCTNRPQLISLNSCGTYTTRCNTTCSDRTVRVSPLK